MWLNLLGMGLKTAGKLYADKQKTKEALSGAKLLHAEKMRRGEIEFSGKVFEHQKGDWKDEFVLIVLSTPIFMLAYSVFTDDPEIERKMDLFFEKLYYLQAYWDFQWCHFFHQLASISETFYFV